VNNLDKDVDDNTPPNPFHYNTKTIFNVLKELGVTWKIYVDGIVTPSLTRYQFITQLSDPLLAPHFRGFNEFQNDAALGTLPSYSFVEPSFIEKKNDQHPPHDVAAGDRFLYDVWKALSTGSAWENTLLIITYDEHGGCYDHVPPPWTAVKPDDSTPQKPFEFDRYGVRVPTVVVSPWIEPGTVFRSGSGAVDYDHTSILATLRDWQDLAGRAKAGWLVSKRIEAAPTLGQVLTRTTPRTVTPEVPVPGVKLKEVPKKTLKKGIPLNSIQSGLAAAALMGSDKGQESYHKVVDQVAEIKTAEDALDRLRKTGTASPHV
jgi:phospholipase C